MQLYHPRMIKAREPTLGFHTRVVGLEYVSAVFSDKSAQAQFDSLPLFGKLKALKISSISSLGTGTERRRRRRSHCSTEQVLEDIYRAEHRQQSMNGSENLGLSLSMVTAQRKEKLIHLFYCAEMEELARNIASLSESIHLYPINWRNFPDGFPHLFIPNAHGIRGQNVAFLASFSSPAVIFEQVSVIYNLPRMFVSSFTLVLPFFPTGTFERVEQEGDVATAFTLARILSNIPISRGGPTSLVTFDIHALQERFYFGDNVLPCFESGIPLLKQRLQQFPSSENIAIAFPDDGAWKRFHTLLSDFPMVVCTKVREGSKRIVRVKEGIAAGYHVVIVDDLVQSGGTLIECQKVLAAHGAKKISAYVTHGVFPNQSWKRFQSDNGNGAEHGFSYFWISDSCPQTVMAVKDHQPFEVLSLAGPIASALQI